MATDTVARTFGEDIAQEVCRIYLTKRPTFTTAPIHWWRATARTERLAARAHQTVRRATRYRTEMRMTQRRVLTPEQTAACWEVLDRVPVRLTLALLEVEGDARSNHTIKRARQMALRREARRWAASPLCPAKRPPAPTLAQ